MTDKEKIREEVERLFNHVKDSIFESDSGAFYYLKDLLDYIDSLQEEPVDKCKGCNNVKGCITCVDGDQWAHYKEPESEDMEEEPESEDMEEAASRYAKEEYNHKSPATLPDRCKGCYAPLMYAFKAGANWRYEQFEKNRLTACDNMTKEEYDREQEFVTDFLEKNLYAPTYSDAIEYGRKIAFDKAIEWLKAYIHYDDFGGNMEWLVPFEDDKCMIQHFKTYMEEEDGKSGCRNRR